MSQHVPVPPTQGAMRVINVATPAAGAGWSHAVPPRVRWRLISGAWLFTTDANVANRFVHVHATRGAVIFADAHQQVAQTASLATEYGLHAGGSGATGSASGGFNLGIAQDLILLAGDIIAGTALNIQATDTFTLVTLYVEEWDDV